ncbi:MAG: DUF885 domain-containing protein [Pseudonocardiales bacterium]|nr:MAG: DUF885 domain-containing protein [Pseudonocardiales bacterium]
MTNNPSAAADAASLRTLAAEAIETALACDPANATYLGAHRYDKRLADPSVAASVARAAQVRAQLAALDMVTAGPPDDAVDAAVLRTTLRAELFEHDRLKEADWNPMAYNPGAALDSLLTRDFAPWSTRCCALAARLELVPDYLSAARPRLADMSRIHVETAMAQLAGTVALIDAVPREARDQAPTLRARVESAAQRARRAVVEHRDWLATELSAATRDPRLGPALFADKLALTLDTDFAPEALLTRAEADLDLVRAQIIEEAGRIAGVAAPDATTVHEVLDRCAIDAPTNETVLTMCRDALADATAFVRELDLVTVHGDTISVVEMPEIERGVAVAYCRPAGPLEAVVLPTEFAVSPTPTDWSTEQVSSFYREYNLHMIHNLTVHEAMPGHALQLMHANRHRGPTPVRAVWSSGSFVEGWAVYAEELMAQHRYRSGSSPDAAGALRMQQLKMRLRTIINAIMDVRFHCDDLDDAAAMELMLGRGFQERGEAAGKWRRVQLSAAQLSTYYVGYCEVRDLVSDLRAARPAWSDRQLHDEVLRHGSPPVRHIRTLTLP